MAEPPSDAQASPDHVVVVLNWNGRTDTLACVESLLDGMQPPTVLVVDNGSYDGTLDDVQHRWPAVSVLQTGENLGFAGGMNRGIAWAQDHGARIITVLNNDTVTAPGAMAALREAARSGDCAASPLIYYRDEPDRVWFAGGTLAPPDWFPHHTAPDRLEAPVDDEREVDVLSGCCVTASAEAWDRVGGFDEDYFLNFEDSEWSVRARRAGLRLIVRTDALVLHAVSRSFTGAASHLGTYYYVRNGLMFIRAAGGDSPARRRFVTRVARDAASRSRRSRHWRSGMRELRMIGRGALDFARGRTGRARPALERRAQRWARRRNDAP